MLCVRVVRIKLNTSVSLVCVRGEGEWCGRLVALMTFSKVFNAPIWAGGVGNQSGVELRNDQQSAGNNQETCFPNCGEHYIRTQWRNNDANQPAGKYQKYVWQLEGGPTTMFWNSFSLCVRVEFLGRRNEFLLVLTLMTVSVFQKLRMFFI